jgi:hypothetical protein
MIAVSMNLSCSTAMLIHSSVKMRIELRMGRRLCWKERSRKIAKFAAGRHPHSRRDTRPGAAAAGLGPARVNKR